MSQDREGRTHVIRAGETTAGLAARHGFAPATIWECDENGALRERRPDPNVLHPGDALFLPARTLREESAATEQSHRFVRKGLPEKLELVIRDDADEPIADERYVVTIEGRSYEGTLDGDGKLSVPVPATALRGHIQVGEEGALLDAPLELGHLDPLDEVTGVQARLQNLGFYAGRIDGRESEALGLAIVAFRRDQGMEASTALDDELRDALRDAFGR